MRYCPNLRTLILDGGYSEIYLEGNEEDRTEEEEAIIMAQVKELHLYNPSSCCIADIRKAFSVVGEIGLYARPDFRE